MANYEYNKNELVLLNDKFVSNSLSDSISTNYGVPTIPSQKLFKESYDKLSSDDKSISDIIEDIISADLYKLSGQYEGTKADVEISCNAISSLIGSISTDLSNAITSDVKHLDDLQISAAQISSKINSLCTQISNDLTAKYSWLSGEASRLCTELSDNVESKFVHKTGDIINGELAIENSLSVKSNVEIDGNLVVGTAAQAAGENIIALGSNANGNSFSHAFIWNSSKDSSYSANDNNTFNINPIDGLNGFYIGDKSMSDTLSEYQLKSAMPTDLSDFQDKSKKYALSADIPTKSSQLENDQGYLISSDFDAKYVKETKKISFTAGSKKWDIDATAFIKDGMLNSARYDGTGDIEHKNPPYIVLTFNADAGKDPIWIECASFVDTYKASGNGIKLDDHTFSLDFNFVGTKVNDDYLSSIAKEISYDVYEKIQPNVNNIQLYVNELSAIGSYEYGNRGIIQTLSDDILSAVNSNIRTVKQINKHIKIKDTSKTYDSLCALFTDHNIYDNDLGVKNGTIVDVTFENNLSGQIVVEDLSICNDEYLLVWDDNKIPYVRLENLNTANVKVLKTGVSQHEFALEIQDRIAVDNYISAQVVISAAALCSELSNCELSVDGISTAVALSASALCTELCACELSVDGISTTVALSAAALCTEISNLSDEVYAISNDLSSAISSKIWIKDLNDDGSTLTAGNMDALSVIKITKDDFDTQVATGTLTMSSNTLYIVSSDYMDAYGQQLCNLTMTEDMVASEAANKHYVDAKDSKLATDINAVSSSVEVIKSKFNADTIATDPVLAKLLEDKNDSDISTVISAVMYIFNTLTQV